MPERWATFGSGGTSQADSGEGTVIDGIVLTQLGIAGVTVGVVFYVFKLLVDGHLHTQSEIAGKDKQIGDLLEANRRLTDALERANLTMQRLIDRAPNVPPAR